MLLDYQKSGRKTDQMRVLDYDKNLDEMALRPLTEDEYIKAHAFAPKFNDLLSDPVPVSDLYKTNDEIGKVLKEDNNLFRPELIKYLLIDRAGILMPDLDSIMRQAVLLILNQQSDMELVQHVDRAEPAFSIVFKPREV